MSEHTFEDLKGKSVAELRELAAELEHDAVQGYTQMRKEQLLEAICIALGIETHIHHEVVGVDKKSVKAKIKRLKERRAEALKAGDRVQLKRVRRQIHRLKRRLRRATV